MRFLKAIAAAPLLGTLILLAGMTFATGTARAEDAPAKGARFQQRLQNDPAFRARVDLNKDGTISDAERAQARKAHQGRRQERHQLWQENNPELVKQMDTNNDGVLDKTEWAQGKTIREQHKQEWLEKNPKAASRLDKNNDGVIDQQEYQRGRQLKRALARKQGR